MKRTKAHRYTCLAAGCVATVACFLCSSGITNAKPPKFFPTPITPAKPKSTAPKVPIDNSPNATTPVPRMTVQSETVTAEELWKGRASELQDKEKSLRPEEFHDYLMQRALQLINDRVMEMLLYQKAALRLESTDDKKIDAIVDSEIRKIVTSEHNGVQRRYEKELQAQGRTLDDVRKELRRQFVIASFLEGEVRPKVAEPTRAELLAAFQANRDSWRKPARRSMSLIDVRVREFLAEDNSNPTTDDLATARAKAHSQILSARAELRSGASFADVAKKYSHDGRAPDGGKWGFVQAESVRERFQPAIAALAKLRGGEVSDVVEAPEDFFIVRCDELEPGIEPDFQVVQPDLREQLFKRAFNQKVAEFVNELRKNARIEPTNLERFHAAVVEAALGQSVASKQ